MSETLRILTVAEIEELRPLPFEGGDTWVTRMNALCDMALSRMPSREAVVEEIVQKVHERLRGEPYLHAGRADVLADVEIPAFICSLSPPSGMPGHALRPREPTEEMYAAAEHEWDGRMSARSAGVWQAMFDAYRE